MTKWWKAVAGCETLWVYTILWANCLVTQLKWWGARVLPCIFTDHHIIYCHQAESLYLSISDIQPMELAALYYFLYPWNWLILIFSHLFPQILYSIAHNSGLSDYTWIWFVHFKNPSLLPIIKSPLCRLTQCIVYPSQVC